MVDAISRRVAGTYDAIHGGFGLEPKFPSTPMLRLLLHRYRTTGEPFFRVMLEKSLDAITDGDLRDRIDGGFFRFTMGSDWTQAQHEKMAEDNIALARCPDGSGHYPGTGETIYRSPARPSTTSAVRCLIRQRSGVRGKPGRAFRILRRHRREDRLQSQAPAGRSASATRRSLPRRFPCCWARRGNWDGRS